MQQYDRRLQRIPGLTVEDPKACNVGSVEVHKAPSFHSVIKIAATFTAFIALSLNTQYGANCESAVRKAAACLVKDS